MVFLNFSSSPVADKRQVFIYSKPKGSCLLNPTLWLASLASLGLRSRSFSNTSAALHYAGSHVKELAAKMAKKNWLRWKIAVQFWRDAKCFDSSLPVEFLSHRPKLVGDLTTRRCQSAQVTTK